MHNICPVTLYHGTSSFFLDSILENGLGGVNIIKEWGVLDLVNEMYPYVAERLSSRPLKSRPARITIGKN